MAIRSKNSPGERKQAARLAYSVAARSVPLPITAGPAVIYVPSTVDRPRGGSTYAA